MSRSSVLLGLIQTLLFGAVFGLPFINGQVIQAQTVAGPVLLPEPPGAMARDWPPAGTAGKAEAIQTARTRYATGTRFSSAANLDLDPWGEHLALRAAMLAREYSAARAARAEFAAFVERVSNGDSDTITGVYVPGIFSYPVEGQPAGNAGYVSGAVDRLTQFNLASQYGTVGFWPTTIWRVPRFNLASGQKVQVIFGDGSAKSYVIAETHSFQAKQPNSPFSDFLELDQENSVWSAEDLFYKMYAGDERVVFQTCIAADGVSTWGRYFVIAIPTP